MIKSPLYSAIFKSVTGRLLTYVFQFAALALYARLFSPEEFGVIASIQVFLIFFQMLADIGVGPAIINEDKFGKKKRDGIFSVTAISGLLLAIVFYFFSYLLNSFYNGYEYQQIAVFVSITIFFSTLNIVPITAMNKDAKFLHLAMVDVFVELFTIIAVYILYTQEFGVLALAARSTVQSIMRFLLTWHLSKNTSIGNPFVGAELFHIKSIMTFSSYQFGFNFINYFSRNLDNILIAKYFGMASVGIYEKAYQLMRYPLMVTTFAMTPAIQPILTKVRSDLSLIIKEHNLLSSRLFAISILISAFIFINSRDVVLLLFGETWIQVEPLIKILSVMIPIQAVMSISGSFFQVMNKPKLLFISGALAAIVNVFGIVIGINIGSMEAVATALVISFTINFVCTYIMLFKFVFKHSQKEFYIKLLKVFLASMPSIILYYMTNYYVLSDYQLSAFLNLLVNSVVGCLLLALFYVPIKKTIT
ncbi:oligosaccharide flippase family protein [Pseudoalteromonas carrageenovora]|uniref:oligosaccharide flippase family protein n=1 Tax=Pseudoalteromonas TaxID=53246 RepID=UPI0007322F32|nr:MULTISPECIES: oligosaccharide flippase family protein [Pseudoalteromonas]KTF16420.1 hypothetical protein ATS74_15580 [Pseudoalteromonas sp. H103]MDO6635797.1 oligosaccharide flippase family protein [Pseudoalteromonas carrageenovora]MDO6647790.1 oligosaccharide flippase family protein [Pseudoalteromonas carrageenovora]